MQPENRLLTGFIFVFSCALCSFVPGAWVGAEYWLPENSGMAGPVIVLAYGLGTAVVVALIATLLAFRLPLKLMFYLNIPLGLTVLILCFLLARFIAEFRVESEQHLQQAYANLLPYSVTLVKAEGSAYRVEFDGGQRFYTHVENQQRCKVELSGKQAADMLTALRGANAVLYNNPSPCSAYSDPMTAELALTIEEALPPMTRSQTILTADCLADYPELYAPFESFEQIDSQRGLKRECQALVE